MKNNPKIQENIIRLGFVIERGGSEKFSFCLTSVLYSGEGACWGSKMPEKLLTLYVDGSLAKQALDYMAKYNTLAAVTPELMARGHEVF